MKDKFGNWFIKSLDDGFEVSGYRVTYNDDDGFGTFEHYDDAINYIKYISDTSGSMSSETPEEKSARELREKSIKRENKINEILGE